MLQAPANEQVRAGEIARGAIQLARELCAKTLDGKILDQEIEQYIRDEGGVPALKGYHPHFARKPYEWTICLAVDEDVVHGVPMKYIGPAKLITVDLVVEYQGWFADTARTFALDANKTKTQFAKHSLQIFQSALEMIMPNQSIDLYSAFVEGAARMHGYAVINEYCGHGIGQAIHTPPNVPNTSTLNQGPFQVGRSYAVEPVLAINAQYHLRNKPNDGFSVRADCLASHNEDTVFVSAEGIINLTGNES